MTQQPYAEASFEDMRVVVTGGGTGIGRAVALAFAGRGAASVIVTGRRPERLAEVAALHPAVVPVTADVRTQEGAEAVAAAVGEHGGQLDVLVHNAGIHSIAPVDGIEPAAASDVFASNVLGPVVLTTRLLPVLRSPGGNIVFVSSAAGHNPTPGSSVYAASKAAVDSLTRTWALELGPRGIRVNGVAPGWVRTEVYELGGMTSGQVDGLFEQAAKEIPLGRTGDPDDVALWVTRFAEPASSWTTGQIITMDGGADLV